MAEEKSVETTIDVHTANSPVASSHEEKAIHKDENIKDKMLRPSSDKAVSGIQTKGLAE